MKIQRVTKSLRPSGFTLMELIVAIAIVIVIAALAASLMKTARENAFLVRATAKIKDLGAAFAGYTTDNNDVLPLEDAPGRDDWDAARQPDATEVWYNVLPRSMSAPAVADLAGKPEQFYQEEYPLYVPGAPYPKDEERFKKPYFAIAMSSRLQRTDKDGYKDPGTLASILEPGRTVAFLERGMPGDQKLWAAQRGFDAGPKANPRAFAARHNQKGLLMFIDGRCEAYNLSDLIEVTGKIKWPDGKVIWTRNPEDNPNQSPQ